MPGAIQVSIAIFEQAVLEAEEARLTAKAVGALCRATARRRIDLRNGCSWLDDGSGEKQDQGSRVDSSRHFRPPADLMELMPSVTGSARSSASTLYHVEGAYRADLRRRNFSRYWH